MGDRRTIWLSIIAAIAISAIAGIATQSLSMTSLLRAAGCGILAIGIGGAARLLKR